MTDVDLAKQFRAQARSYRLGRYIPQTFRRNWYVVSLSIGTSLVLTFTLFEAGQHLSLVELLVGGVGTATLVGGSWGTYIHLDLWFGAAHSQIGRFGPFPLVNYEANRSIYLMHYREAKGKQTKDDKGKVTWEHPFGTLELFEIVRHGQYMNRVFVGNGPVSVAPARQRKVVADLQAELDATGIVPEAPSGTHLQSGSWNGRTYEIHADFYPFELGDEDTIPTYPPEIQKWISDTWRDASPLTPQAKVLFAWKLLPEESDASTDARTVDVSVELAEWGYRYRVKNKQWEEAMDDRKQRDSAMGGGGAG